MYVTVQIIRTFQVIGVVMTVLGKSSPSWITLESRIHD